MTIKELLVLYERNHVAFLKDRVGTSRRIQRYVGQLAHLDLHAVKRMQVIDWFHAIAQQDGKQGANLALQQLHAIYARAIDWELFDGKNPADRIKKFPKRSRERFVQASEMPYLMAAIQEEMPRTSTYFLCLLWTGARRDEARLMKWTDLDLAKALWHKPTTKTGVPHTIPLPSQLVTKLQQLPRVNEWVFPSHPNGKNNFQAGQWSVTSVESAWQRIRARASLPDVRIHDLRRTCASWLAINGENLPVIQRTLNHSSLVSTQVYARLSVAPVRRALNDQAEQMLGSLPAEPVNAIPQEWPG
ncbi:MAG TPA: site-specific integrase [Nitrospiraceae bacterium]|nr:site-specific integrase [Nitrospiraceae bacterium]